MADMGRPTDYTPELAAKICAQLAMGKSVRTVCKSDDMPSATTVFNWLGSRPDFVEQYTRAKEESADVLSEDMMDISDDATNDYMEALGDEGGIAYKLNGENIQRSKLRVETRKWLASKLKPKKYGDKTAIVGPNDGPLQVEFGHLTAEQLIAHAQDLVKDFPGLLPKG